MAFYVSYKNSETVDKTTRQERIPLSVINGNRKPQRTKESYEVNQLSVNFEPDVGKSNLSLPFSIFSDNETYVPTAQTEEKEIETSLTPLRSCDCEKSDSFVGIFKAFENENVPPDEVKRDETDYLEFSFPYKKDNFAHLQNLELKYRSKPNYIHLQAEVTASMRAVLVDWLVEVGLQFEFSSEAVHLAVSLTDRFLSNSTVSKNKLQLVGIASLFITAKYEEVVPQELKLFSWITDSTYTKKQILRMEQLIMHRLEFYVGGPTSLSFAHLAYSMVRTPKKVLYLAQYLCELALLDLDPFLSFLPSEIGVASYCLARYILRYTMWVDELKDTGYSVEKLKLIIEKLHSRICAVPMNSLRSIVQKYSHPDFLRVAEIELPEVLIICD